MRRTVLMIALLCTPGCIRYAEVPTQHGTFKYLNIGFATAIDDMRVKSPDGFEGELKGVKADSSRAIDALADLAKNAAALK